MYLDNERFYATCTFSWWNLEFMKHFNGPLSIFCSFKKFLHGQIRQETLQNRSFPPPSNTFLHVILNPIPDKLYRISSTINLDLPWKIPLSLWSMPSWLWTDLHCNRHHNSNSSGLNSRQTTKESEINCNQNSISNLKHEEFYFAGNCKSHQFRICPSI